jgi:hypothetical protein
MFNFELFPKDFLPYGGLNSDGTVYFFYFQHGQCLVFRG